MATNNAINANSTTPLSTANGGTGVNSVTTAPTASAFAGWDSNSNQSANNHINGYATTATAAGTTTLTVASAYYQFFTGTTTQTVKMPVTSTLVTGQSWFIVNNSTGIVTVESSGSNTITALAGGTAAIFTCISTSGTSASSWNSTYAELETPVVVSQGGTGNTSATAYALIAGGTTSTGVFQSLSSGTSGYVLTSGGSSALPSWSNTPTLQSITFSPTTDGIVGTTAGDAASSGYVGQLFSSQVLNASAVSLSTGVSHDITSITLSAGDYDIWGNININFGGTANSYAAFGWINSSSATMVDLSKTAGMNIGSTTFTTSATFGFSIAPITASIASSTTYYLSTQFSGLSGATATASGIIIARRRR